MTRPSTRRGKAATPPKPTETILVEPYGDSLVCTQDGTGRLTVIARNEDYWAREMHDGPFIGAVILVNQGPHGIMFGEGKAQVVLIPAAQVLAILNITPIGPA